VTDSHVARVEMLRSCWLRCFLVIRSVQDEVWT